MQKRQLYAIFAIIFVNIFGAMMILPVLALYAKGQFGASVQLAALLATAYFGAQFLAAPVLGRLSDRFGRRPLLIISQAGTVLSFIMFIYAEQLGDWVDGFGLGLALNSPMVVMFAARILDGITGGNITIARAYVSDISTPETRTQSLGLLTAAFGMGFIFGPAVGGLLSNLSLLAPFYGATLITLLTLLLTALILQESLPPEQRTQELLKRSSIPLRQALQDRNLALLLLITFIQSLAFSAIPAVYALYAEMVVFPDITDLQQVSSNVGVMLAYSGLVTVITQAVLIKHIVRWLGEPKMVPVGMAIFFSGLAITPLFTHPLLVTLMFTPYSLGRGIVDPSLQSLISKLANPQHRGRYLGLYQSATSLALIFGPIYSGWVFDNISPQAIFWVSGIILLPGLLLALLVRPRLKQAITG